MSEVILDASALLALLNDEPGASRVLECLPHAHISTVNLAEVVGKLVEHGVPAPKVKGVITDLGITAHPFSKEAALIVGELRPTTRHLGLSLGDRACIALGMEKGFPILTADRAWERIDLHLEIELIRSV